MCILVPVTVTAQNSMQQSVENYLYLISQPHHAAGHTASPERQHPSLATRQTRSEIPPRDAGQPHAIAGPRGHVRWQP